MQGDRSRRALRERRCSEAGAARSLAKLRGRRCALRNAGQRVSASLSSFVYGLLNAAPESAHSVLFGERLQITTPPPNNQVRRRRGRPSPVGAPTFTGPKSTRKADPPRPLGPERVAVTAYRRTQDRTIRSRRGDCATTLHRCASLSSLPCRVACAIPTNTLARRQLQQSVVVGD
jgi:hypothetical protein